MKLRFVKTLNEADINRGDRLLKLKDINDNIKGAVEAAGYAFKDAGEKGFYILPKMGFIAKITLEKVKDENAYNVSIFDAFNKEHAELKEKILVDDAFDIKLQDNVIANALKLIFQISPTDVTKLQTVVSEALPKFLQAAVDKIKNNIDISAKRKVKKQEDKIKSKHDSADFISVAKQCELIAKKALSKMPGKNREVDVIVQVKDNKIDISFKGDVVAGVAYEPFSAGKNLRVASCITAIAKTDVECSLAAFIGLLNRKLGLKIQLKNDVLLKATGSSDAEIKKLNSFEASLTAQLDDEILTKLGESLSEALGDNVAKYDAALSSVKNDVQGEALVKLYFYRETRNKLELTDYQARDLYKAIKSVKSFDASKSPLVKIFIKYYRKNKKSSNLKEELKNLTTILSANDFAAKIKDINDRKSLIYNSEFIGKGLSPNVASDIYNNFQDVKKLKPSSKETEESMISNKLKLIKNKFAIKLPPTTLQKTVDLANFIVFADYQKLVGMRDTKLILDMCKVITDSEDSEEEVKKPTSQAAPQQLDALKPVQVSNLTKLFTLKETEGVPALTELIDKLKNPQNKDTKELLIKLLNQVK